MFFTTMEASVIIPFIFIYTSLFVLFFLVAINPWEWMLRLHNGLAARLVRGKVGGKRNVYNDINSLTAPDRLHETALTFRNMVVQEGAGSWPPMSNFDKWPNALQPFLDIYNKLSVFLSTEDISMDDESIRSRRMRFRSMAAELLRDRVHLRDVELVMNSAESGSWDSIQRCQCNAFYCTVAVLRHAYREVWATIPVVRDAQAEAVVNFPPELDVPWKFLQRIYGCTADSGNNTSNVLHNFDKNGRWTLWINNGVSEKIRSTELGFFKIFYEVEVKALPVYLEMIQSIVAYDAGDIKACSSHLRNMSPLLHDLFQEFYQGITPDKVSKDFWLRYCQGFQGWGVGSKVAGKYVRYNGLSGNQVLVFHVLDAFLDLPSYLSMEDIVRYIPARQRDFTRAVRRHSFRSRVGAHGDPAIHEAFSRLISQMKLFRAAHKHRVMPYLKVPAPERYYMTAGKPTASGEGVKDVAGALQPLEDLLVARLRETV